MRVKNVVKVMNFHALLRVNAATTKAELYAESENELTLMINLIVNNQNFILDKKVLTAKADNPPLNIYIGNDFGFCGNFNSSINSILKSDIFSPKILIGKKLAKTKDKPLLRMNKDEFSNRFKEIEAIIGEAINNFTYSKINVIYNHYHNANTFETMRKTIFPIERKESNVLSTEDFVVETDINEILINLVTLYISYEIMIAATYSYAAENIMRQQITSESLKKIDEIEAATLIRERKEKKYRSFQKSIENYSRNIIRKGW